MGNKCLWSKNTLEEDNLSFILHSKYVKFSKTVSMMYWGADQQNGKLNEALSLVKPVSVIL